MPGDFKLPDRVVPREPAKVGTGAKVDEVKREFAEDPALAKAAAGAAQGWAPKTGDGTPPPNAAAFEPAGSGKRKAKVALSGEYRARAAPRQKLKLEVEKPDLVGEAWAQLRQAPPDLTASKDKPSPILSVLGKDRFAEVTAVRTGKGRIVWFNPELARELGFHVPESNQLTPELERELLDALDYHVLQPGEDPGDRPTIKMYADKYGGTGLGWNGTKGSTRTAFFPTGNLASKGVRVIKENQGENDTLDFHHSHGNASMYETSIEASAGELSANLFRTSPRRSLAIIDNQEDTVYPDGGRERAARVVFAGSQLRPGHFVEGWYDGQDFSVPAFVRATASTGDLVTRPDPVTKEPIPDLRATMLKLIDKQAQTSAESFRWRVLHGAVSTSNMGLDGGLNDFYTFATQNRTARIKMSKEGHAFGSEQDARANELGAVYRGLVGSLPPAQRNRYHGEYLDAAAEMRARYQQHLEAQLLEATGLKPELAGALQAQEPQLAKDFTRTLVALMKLGGRGAINADKVSADDSAVADVFAVLQKFPPTYFESPPTERLDAVRRLLAPRLTMQGAQTQKTSERLDRLSEELLAQYGQVMAKAEALSPGFYDSPADFRRAVETRASFENEPISLFVRPDARAFFEGKVESYKSSGDRDVMHQAIDFSVANSVRSIDGLLRSGGKRVLADGGLELERRTIDGVQYSVRGWDAPGQPRRIHVSVPATEKDGRLVLELRGSPSMSLDEAKGLRYHFAARAGEKWQDAPATVTTDEQGRTHVDFDIPALGSDVGQLEGVFYGEANGGQWIHRIQDVHSNFRGYTFAVPDAHDLRRLAEESHGG